MVLYPYVASLLGYIDELYMDHDHGCLNMSEVRLVKRNLVFAIKMYIFHKHFSKGAGHKELHTSRL